VDISLSTKTLVLDFEHLWLTDVLGVKQVFTSAYRPTTNGQVERWNATLVDAIATLTFERDWDLSVGLACVAYNATVHSTTGYAPI
jgi:transposase InsO family protein